MSTDRIRDGHRIAQLLASELESGASPDAFAVTDADPDVEPTPEGALAYRVRDTATDGTIATVYVQPDRVRVEFRAAPAAVAEAAEAEGLRVRPKAAAPPRTVVFVEDGAQVKRVRSAFGAALGDG
ncbi:MULTISPECIES: hypothetical protein [Halolamina]|uniref:DUF7993 domain-containing protein n=1 Tax=Halolamina pelagica TaxID=699431 RepID=A0A1I5MAW5_9EURY|nr:MULTISPECIES: hypothetical protein [Halolamina]NHX35947.1 hypothetical protein [Halolamina sp. R1-12]SFP06695.1 hypothetical protein SAMN05216277_101188 [Halolamina pelagica]